MNSKAKKSRGKKSRFTALAEPIHLVAGQPAPPRTISINDFTTYLKREHRFYGINDNDNNASD